MLHKALPQQRLRKLIHKHHSGAHARWHMLCRGFHNMQMLIQEATSVHLWQRNLLTLSLSPSACTASLMQQGPVASPSLLLLASHGMIHGMQHRQPANMWRESRPTDLELLYQGLHSQPDVGRPSSLVPTAAAARAPWWRWAAPSGGLCGPYSCHAVTLQVHQLALQVVCAVLVLPHILQVVLLCADFRQIRV